MWHILTLEDLKIEKKHNFMNGNGELAGIEPAKNAHHKANRNWDFGYVTMFVGR